MLAQLGVSFSCGQLQPTSRNFCYVYIIVPFCAVSPDTEDIYKEARKVVVAAILHTDNANHFAMIKDISQAFEAQEARLLCL